MHGEHDDACLGALLDDASGGLDAVDLRHRHVHEDHVRLELLGQVHRLLAVRCLPDHVEALVEHGSLQRLPEHPVVVGEQQSDGFGHVGLHGDWDGRRLQRCALMTTPLAGTRAR